MIFLIGANYWARSSGPLMWRNWRPQEIEAELGQMRSLGMNVCRSFLYMPDFMPEPDTVSEVMLERLDEFVQLCRKVGIYAVPTFFVGHMSGEDWDVPWREGRDFYRDPWMLQQEIFYVQTVAERYRGEEAVLAWLLSNELTNYAGPTDPASGRLWARIICEAIREVDSRHPIGIGDGAWQISGVENGLGPEDLDDIVDFHGPHTYPQETDFLRHSNMPSFLIKMTELSKPTILEEFGCSTAHCSPEHQADYYRTTLHSVFLAGGGGALAWCYTDFDLPRQRPYSHHAFELLFGVTAADGQVKPAGREIQRFAGLMAKVDLDRFSLPEPQAGLIVPSYLTYPYPYGPGTPARALVPTHYAGGEPSKALDIPDKTRILGALLEGYVLGKQAQIYTRFLREPVISTEAAAEITEGEGLRLPAEIKLALAPNTQALTAPTWEAIYEYVEQGGTFYYSYHPNMWIHNFEPLFGCRHHLRFGLADLPPEEFTLTFGEDFGSMRAGESLRYRRPNGERLSAFCPVSPTTAKVVATDERGNPALLVNPIGRGQVVFCTYPLEYYLFEEPDVRSADSTYRLYQGLADVAGLTQVFEFSSPFVETGYLRGENEYLVWLINHAWEAVDGELKTDLQLKSVEDFETGQPSPRQVSLPAKEVRVLRIQTL